MKDVRQPYQAPQRHKSPARVKSRAGNLRKTYLGAASAIAVLAFGAVVFAQDLPPLPELPMPPLPGQQKVEKVVPPPLPPLPGATVTSEPLEPAEPVMVADEPVEEEQLELVPDDELMAGPPALPEMDDFDSMFDTDAETPVEAAMEEDPTVALLEEILGGEQAPYETELDAVEDDVADVEEPESTSEEPEIAAPAPPPPPPPPPPPLSPLELADEADEESVEEVTSAASPPLPPLPEIIMDTPTVVSEAEPVKKLKKPAPRSSVSSLPDAASFKRYGYSNQLRQASQERGNKHLPHVPTSEQLVETAFKAAALNNINGLRAILDGAPLLSAQNAYGESLLSWSMRHRATASAKLLLARGADSNSKDARGVPVLHYAVLTGDLSAVKAMLNAGARVNQPAPDGRTALDVALQENNQSAAALLLQYAERAHAALIQPSM